MKYLIMPIFYIIIWLITTLTYVIIQILYIIRQLKPNKHLLSDLIKNNYYCYTERKENGEFSYNSYLNKKEITTNSPFIYLKWLFKYGLGGEMKDLTKKEREEYIKFIKKKNT